MAIYTKYNLPSDEMFREIVHSWLAFANDNYTEVENIKETPGWFINDEQLAAIKSEYIESLVYREKAQSAKY